jgi:ATP-dependent DNA ligase
MWLATSLLPDDELSAFARLPDIEDLLKRCRSTDVAEQRTAMQQFSEHHKEEERLRKVAMTDSAFTQTETIESFVSFLRGLNPRAQDYWPLVYRRIRLAYPSACSPARAAEVSKPKTSWLRKLFG